MKVSGAPTTAGEPLPGSPGRYDFSAEHILNACEQSLKRLGIQTIDIYMLHRPDWLADPEEIAGAFSKLKEAGKVGVWTKADSVIYFDDLQITVK